GASPLHYKPLSASVTTSRGTELFGLFVDPDGNDIGVSGTRSNIELRPAVLSLVGTNSHDDSSMTVATADGGTTVDVFWRYADKTLGTVTWNGTSFVAPTNLPPYGQFRAGVGAAGQTNREDLFGVGLDGNLWQAWRATGSWNGWINIGSPTSGLASLQPAVVYLPG